MKDAEFNERAQTAPQERSYSIMFSKKKTKCRVCGHRFTPERENLYTAEEPRSVAEMLMKPATRFSAVDCPVCGCQIALAIRAPRIDLPAITKQHDADAEETEGEVE
jgi:rubredoxin